MSLCTQPTGALNTNGHEGPFYGNGIFYSGLRDYAVGFCAHPHLQDITIAEGDKLIQAWNQLTLKLFLVFKHALGRHRLNQWEYNAYFSDANQQTAWNMRIAFFKKLSEAKDKGRLTFSITPNDDPANLDRFIQAACDVDHSTIRVQCIPKFASKEDRKSPIAKQ